MCECVYVGIYVSAPAFICEYACECVSVSERVCVLCEHVCMCVNICVCGCVCVYLCMSMCIAVCVLLSFSRLRPL